MHFQAKRTLPVESRCVLLMQDSPLPQRTSTKSHCSMDSKHKLPPLPDLLTYTRNSLTSSPVRFCRFPILLHLHISVFPLSIHYLHIPSQYAIVLSTLFCRFTLLRTRIYVFLPLSSSHASLLYTLSFSHLYICFPSMPKPRKKGNTSTIILVSPYGVERSPAISVSAGNGPHNSLP